MGAHAEFDDQGRLRSTIYDDVFCADDLDAAVGVCVGLDVGPAARTLGGLVDRSVVVWLDGGRYALLETVKEFVRRSWSDETPVQRHERWLFDHLAAQDPEARFVDFDLVAWIHDRRGARAPTPAVPWLAVAAAVAVGVQMGS